MVRGGGSHHGQILGMWGVPHGHGVGGLAGASLGVYIDTYLVSIWQGKRQRF